MGVAEKVSDGVAESVAAALLTDRLQVGVALSTGGGGSVPWSTGEQLPKGAVPRSLDTDRMLPALAAEIAERQLGVITRQQLLQNGVSAGQLRWAVGRRWRVLLPRVVLLNSGLPNDEQRLMAAQLFAGSDSWLAGPTAAALHGLPGCALAPPIHLLVPPHRTSRSVSWVRVSRSYLLDERLVTRGPLRISCRPRALVDAAAWCPEDAEARALVIEAVQQRLVRLDDVAHWMEVRSNHGRRRLRRALAEASLGAWSLPEADLLRLLERDAELPSPWANPVLRDADGRRLTTPDVWFDEVALAVMVHSRQFHAGVLDWEATVTADEDLRAAGVEVVGVTPESIASHPDRVLTRIRAAHRRAASRPKPAGVVAQPAGIRFPEAAREAANWR